MDIGDFWEELNRRRVVRVGVGYAVVVFVVLQVADLVLPPLGVPEWTMTFLVVLALGGFPVSLVLAWAFDVTPDGIERTGLASEGEGASRGAGRKGLWALAALACISLLIAGGRALSVPPLIEPGDIDPEVIVVMPFRVSGSDAGLENVIREGILDLLSPHFSESPRMIDVGAMVAAWRSAVASDAEDLPEREALELARRLGAGRLVLGSVVGTAEAFTATARLLRVSDGERIGDVTVDGGIGQLAALASRLPTVGRDPVVGSGRGCGSGVVPGGRVEPGARAIPSGTPTVPTHKVCGGKRGVHACVGYRQRLCARGHRALRVILHGLRRRAVGRSGTSPRSNARSRGSTSATGSRVLRAV